MKLFWIFPIAALLWGCATAEMGRQIMPEDVVWIQKGMTVRSQVVKQLGAPFSEVPDWSAMKFQSTSTTTTNKEGEKQQSVTTTTVEPINKVTKAVGFTRYSNNLTYIATRQLDGCMCAE